MVNGILCTEKKIFILAFLKKAKISISNSMQKFTAYQIASRI